MSKFKVEQLPFTIRIAKSQQDIERAVEMRQKAYSRTYPELALTLTTPEPADFLEGVAVLLVESKKNNEVLGTIRLQTNKVATLPIQRDVELPDWLLGKKLLEGTRLGVVSSEEGKLVKVLIFKALYLYCLKNDIEYAIAAGRVPMDKQYQGLLFKDVFPDGPYIPLAHASNVPHRIFALDIPEAQKNWEAANHPWNEQFFYTQHPDINLNEGVN